MGPTALPTCSRPKMDDTRNTRILPRCWVTALSAPNWVTPGIPRGFFVSTSRLPSTPMEEGVSSSHACNSGGYPGVPRQRQSEATKPDPRTNPTATHTRRRVLCTLPPLDHAAAATSQTCTGHKVDGLLHKTKEQTKTRIAIPPQPPQAKRTQTRERISSTLLPPRDPLLQPAMITPPCPIPEGQQPTPAKLRSYTHVSETKKYLYTHLVLSANFLLPLGYKFINCILMCCLDFFFFFCRRQINRII